jgi:hypothetical protein
VNVPPTNEGDMTEQAPEPTADDPAVEPEKTTNDVDAQDDAWIDEDQSPEPQPYLGGAPEDDDDVDGAQ